MYYLMNRLKESQYARLCMLLGFCCATVFVFINLNNSNEGPSKSSLKIQHMSAEDDEFPGEMMVGGLNKGTIEKDDKVTAVVNKIKPVLEEKSQKKFEELEVVHYRTQVVAGTNFFVKAKAKVDGADQIVHLRIYRDLQGALELTAYQLDRTLEEDLKYFQ